jgi:hypothetical protein
MVGNVVAELLPELPDTSKPAGLGLLTGTVKVFLKDELPPAAKVAGTVISAAMAGKKLADNIQQALNAGQPANEAYVCQTVRTVTEELAGKTFKGAIISGIPPYLAAAAANPPLAATIPVIVPLIPQAYQGAQAAANVTGRVVEAACHRGFDFARKLMNKEE